jgi:hypothetical protein
MNTPKPHACRRRPRDFKTRIAFYGERCESALIAACEADATDDKLTASERRAMAAYWSGRAFGEACA